MVKYYHPVHLKKYLQDLFNRPEKQIPVLDGVRTLAILLVVGLHTNVHMIHHTGLPSNVFTGLPPFRGGWIGVPLFFILSGYFIGGQLWKEFSRTGSVMVGHFILRRGLRIWPLYYFCFLLSYSLFPEKANDFWSNLLFVANYLGDAGPIRGSWSLSTEEQFYIIIPTLVFVCAHVFKFKTLRSYRRLLFAMLFLPILTRGLTWYYLTGFETFDMNLYRFYIYRPIHTHFDGLIVGLLLSNIAVDKSFKVPRIMKSPYLFLVSMTLVGVFLKLSQKVLFTYFALSIIFGAFFWMVTNKENFITKILSIKPFYTLAKVSFGVYLVHHPILWALDEAGWFTLNMPSAALLWLSYGVVFTLSCVFCCVTYVMVEAPFIAWRNDLLKARSKRKEPAKQAA